MSMTVCQPISVSNNALPGPLAEQTLLILTATPGEESASVGGLISRCCARGRPPYLIVLTDGCKTRTVAAPFEEAVLAATHERETRAAAVALGLDADRILFVGVHEGTAPMEGPLFDALVAAVVLLMWARDCGIIVAPDRGARHADAQAAAAVAAAVAAETGVGLVVFGGGDADRGHRLLVPIGVHQLRKQAALDGHTLLPPFEVGGRCHDVEPYLVVDG